MIYAAKDAAVAAGVDPFVLLVTALGGATVAALIGLLGAWIQNRREHSKWLRERRLARYDAFLSAAAETRFAVSIGEDDRYKAGLERTTNAVAELLLVGPNEVHDLAGNVQGALVSFDPDGELSLDYYSTRALFILAGREALGIKSSKDDSRRRAREKKAPTEPRGSGAELEDRRILGNERAQEAIRRTR